MLVYLKVFSIWSPLGKIKPKREVFVVLDIFVSDQQKFSHQFTTIYFVSKTKLYKIQQNLELRKKVKKSQKYQNVYDLCGTLESQYYFLNFYWQTFSILLHSCFAITSKNLKLYFGTPLEPLTYNFHSSLLILMLYFLLLNHYLRKPNNTFLFKIILL